MTGCGVPAQPHDPRVVIVHDYLTQRGGAERVVLAMLQAFPQARLVTTLHDPAGCFPQLASRPVQTSALQRVGALRRDPRRAFPLLAPAVGRLRLPPADVILCSSSGWAHGVRTTRPTLVYCHNPPRWVHQRGDYGRDQPPAVRAAMAAAAPVLRRWDRRAAHRASRYLANSSIVQQRIRAAYGIQAGLLPPPISLDPGGPQEPVPGVEPGFLLAVGRRRGYKNIEPVCAAVADLPGERLVVVGGLPSPAGRSGWPARLRGVQDLPDAQLRWLYAHCSALVSVAHEDFGLTPLEANAFGRPALVLRAGGFLDTLAEGVSGWYVESADPQAVAAAVQRLRAQPLDPAPIRAHAARYSMERFVHDLRAEVQALLPGQAGL